jgi:hypothetical protein
MFLLFPDARRAFVGLCWPILDHIFGAATIEQYQADVRMVDESRDHHQVSAFMLLRREVGWEHIGSRVKPSRVAIEVAKVEKLYPTNQTRILAAANSQEEVLLTHTFEPSGNVEERAKDCIFRLSLDLLLSKVKDKWALVLHTQARRTCAIQSGDTRQVCKASRVRIGRR